eukprot:2311853-Prymnesium_polylepis.1
MHAPRRSHSLRSSAVLAGSSKRTHGPAGKPGERRAMLASTALHTGHVSAGILLGAQKEQE